MDTNIIRGAGTASGTDSYAVTITLNDQSLIDNGVYVIEFTNANTGASTLDVNGIGATAIKKDGGVDLVADDIKAGGLYLLVYDGTNFQVSSVPSAGATFTDRVIFDSVVSSALTGTTNNLVIAGISSANVIRISATINLQLTGIDVDDVGNEVADSQIFLFVNIGTGNITLVNNSASSDPENRFLLQSNIVINADESALIWYDGVAQRFRVVN